MQQTNIFNNLYPQEIQESNKNRLNYQRVSYELENLHISHKSIIDKNFMNGLQNARNILNNLESSLRKTKKYEEKLAKCRSSHSHTHDVNEWWESDISGEKSKCSRSGSTTKSFKSQVDFAESWSTMSIVCLQYQYEELAKRYTSLLQAYNERGSSLNSREAALARLRQRVRTTHARLAHAHRTLLVIGEKYLALRDKRLSQKSEYETKIKHLKRSVQEVVGAAERARADLDLQITENLGVEKDASTALLLEEIRKCNLLFMENLRLKAQLETFTPGNLEWQP